MPAQRGRVRVGDFVQAHFDISSGGGDSHPAIGQIDFTAALEEPPIFLCNASARSQFHIQRHGQQKAQVQVGGDAPGFHRFASAVVDRPAHRLVQNAGEHAAMHPPRIALVDGLAAEAGQDFRAAVVGAGLYLTPPRPVSGVVRKLPIGLKFQPR